MFYGLNIIKCLKLLNINKCLLYTALIILGFNIKCFSLPRPQATQAVSVRKKYCSADTCSVRNAQKGIECNSLKDCFYRKCSVKKGKPVCVKVLKSDVNQKDECTDKTAKKACAYNNCEGFTCKSVIGEKKPENHKDCDLSGKNPELACGHVGCSSKGMCEKLPGMDPKPGVVCKDEDCFSTYCSGKTCTKKNTPGEKKCNLADPNSCTHLECEGSACKRKSGVSADTGRTPCTTESAASNECSRLVCNSEGYGRNKKSICKRLAGKELQAGEEACTKEGDEASCGRKVCAGDKCIAKPGKTLVAGEIDCSPKGDADCVISVCLNDGMCKNLAKDKVNDRHKLCNIIDSREECSKAVCKETKCDRVSIYDYRKGEQIDCDPKELGQESRTCWEPGCQQYACVKVAKGFKKDGDCTEVGKDKQCYHMGCPDYETETGACVKVRGPGNDDKRCKNNDCPKPPFEIPSLIPDISLVPDIRKRCVAPLICIPTVNGEGAECSGSRDCPLRLPRDKNLINFTNDKTENSYQFTLKKLKTLSTYGSLKAPVTLEAFLDHTCGMCRYAFNEVILELANKYVKNGKLLIIYREFPLLLTDQAVAFSEAVLCANEQDPTIYSNYLAKLYSKDEDRKKPKIKHLSSYAKELGLDVKKFKDCTKSDRMLKQIDRDQKLGEQRKIDGTPIFYINGRKLVGAQAVDKFIEIIEDELADGMVSAR